MPLTGDGQVNKKAFRIAINSRKLARFHPLDREKTEKSVGGRIRFRPSAGASLARAWQLDGRSRRQMRHGIVTTSRQGDRVA